MRPTETRQGEKRTGNAAVYRALERSLASNVVMQRRVGICDLGAARVMRERLPHLMGSPGFGSRTFTLSQATRASDPLAPLRPQP
jgi:hypothetical protein